MPAEFLGKGWSFPIVATPDGEIGRGLYEDGIHDAVWLILSTAKGERVMRPDFGCGIYDLVFGVNNATTAGKIAQEVTDALVLWEPRIDVLSVDVAPDASDPAVLLVRIAYSVRATNNVFNLVYPFYLDRSGA